MPDMLVIVLRARFSVKCSGPDVSTRSDGSPTSVPLEAKRTPRPSASTVALMPSGAMVAVPGPDALTVIELPVELLVRLTNRDPVVLMTVDPSAATVMVLYSLSTGNAKWTAKPQKVAGRSKGVAAANDRCGSLFAAAGFAWIRIPVAANNNTKVSRARLS